MFSQSTAFTAITMISMGLLVCCLPGVLPAQTNEPAINVWYGNNQTFGTPGNPVPAINILGNVAGFSGPFSLSYTLNGGAPRPLSIGPDTRRLERAGDFNIDIPHKELSDGPNQIIVAASGLLRISIRETVNVSYHAGLTWPLPYSTEWSSAASIQEEAQILDGRWVMESGAVRPAEPGYDRMITLGEESWTDYEVTVPVKILAIDSSGFDPPSNGCGIGFLMRWPGHSDLPSSVAGWQPKTGYLPLGALAWYEWRPVGETYRILGNNLAVLDQDSTGRRLLMNRQYIFKARVESAAGQGSLYKMKVWEEGTPEPADWDLVGRGNLSDPLNGSLVLMAHHVDALFGDVSVMPLTVPVPSSIQSDDFSAPQLNSGLWNFVNPVGDASFSMAGTTTSDAWVNIFVPGGVNHEPWTAGNRAPRIMQPANNTDFEVEAKFEAGMTQRYQLQGIFVQENDNHYLRFEFYSDGIETRMLAAALVNNVPTTFLNTALGGNGTAPLYMRVMRSGNTWFMRRSFDGITWTNVVTFNHQFTVSSVGFYGGNTGTNPQFLASIDYFFNTASPVIPEDPTHLAAPTILQHPSNQTVAAGQTASFSVVAGGTQPLSYQWQKNATDIAGATSASYTTPATVQGDSGATFRCRVTNPFGNVTSNSAILNVVKSPAITSHPAHQTVALGSTATFAVVATGTAPLSYQWQKNGTNIAGATSASYTTPATVQGDSGATFRCRVTNPFGNVTSNSAILNVVKSPAITSHPAHQTVALGSTATFAVVATGTAPLTYQWQKNGTNITGATSASYTTPATVQGDSGATFRCRVTNPFGNVTSNSAILNVVKSPAITSHPAHQTVALGSTATFAVVATGTAPLTYQWQKNGTNITGATSASYTTPATVQGDSGATFRCRVTNPFGNVTSNSAILNVVKSPAITSHPAHQTVALGSTATFAVVATGTAPLSYQWQKNGTNITGATSASYTTGPVTLANDGDLHRCRVSNLAGSVLSNAAILTIVSDGPRITEGLLVLYDFEEGQGGTVHDVSGKGAPLDLTIAHTSRTDWEAGYLKVVGKTVIKSSIAATKVIDSVRATNQITIEAWIRPYPGDDDGATDGNGNLGRIVSCAESQNPGKRNFSLDQAGVGEDDSPGEGHNDDPRYETRFKTTQTDNQIRPYLKTADGTVHPNLTHVVYTRSQTGEARMYLNGVVASSGNIPGNASNWSRAYKLSIANEVSLNRSWFGELHLVAIYKKALTPSEVALNFNAGASPAPSIISHPANRTVTQGSTATFTVLATGTAPLSYQWEKNGASINGATSASYTTPPTVPADNGATFRCRVSNVAGSTTTNEATLHVNHAAPVVTTSTCDCKTGTFSHTVTGDFRLLVVGISLETGDPAKRVSSVKYAGINLTRLAEVRSPGGDPRVDVWYLVAPPNGNNTVSVTLAKKNKIRIGAVSFSGVNQDNPITGTVTGGAASGSPNLMVSSAEGDLVMDVVGSLRSSISPDAGQVVLWNKGMHDSGKRGAAGTKPGTAALVNMRWSGNEKWAGVGFNINRSGALKATPESETHPPEVAMVPGQFALMQNYPNPFNPTTRIQFALPRAARVTLILHDVLGQPVRTIVDQVMDAGFHESELDARDLSSGVYFYRLQASDFSAHRKLVLLK